MAAIAVVFAGIFLAIDLRQRGLDPSNAIEIVLAAAIGGFLGAWLGGKAFEANGNYNWIWYIDIVLAVGAALIHLPIREAPLPARKAA